MLLQPHLQQSDLPQLIRSEVGAMRVGVGQQSLDIIGSEQSPGLGFRCEQCLPHPAEITAFEIDDRRHREVALPAIDHRRRKDLP